MVIPKELQTALENIKDETTYAGVAAYTVYTIATWLSEFGDFNSAEVDLEYTYRVYPWSVEFLNSDYDDPEKPFIECINNFMSDKVFYNYDLSYILEDDDSETGGTAYSNETLKEFLLDLMPYEKPTSWKELNSLLIKNGIKPIPYHQ